MAKKDFKKGFDALLSSEMTKEASESNIEKKRPSTKQVIAKKEPLVKVNYRISTELYNTIKDMAYWERVTMNEMVVNALTLYTSKNKKKGE
ncbi:hypothetical protein OAN22_02125 [Alphaproteobacteria bacterium]|nr:hypothetical protein [Alphaproteobacteria bacterium]